MYVRVAARCAEFFGLGGLVLCIESLAVTAGLDNPNRPVDDGLTVGFAALGSGLTVCFLIYCLGGKSGAHFNPIVTGAFCLRGTFSWVWVPWYWLAQFSGSVAGAAVVRAMYGETARLGSVAVNAAVSDGSAFVGEMVLSCFFVAVVLTMAVRGGNVGPMSAVAVGFSFAVFEMIGWTYTGGSLNPFRWLGPALVNDAVDSNAWLYLVAPCVGALLAVLIVRLFTDRLKQSDYHVPQGVGGDEENAPPATGAVTATANPNPNHN